ncbi:TraR/DksA C4-type zinc finger protein [Schnuerera sp. xch1]|uniref:TraR/DksA C4-type zinc finger protein n=1 Tax=Schnuerera sp. xch1 TaxID=2874283 RepID=UPI001CBC3079|nr:TraR/DksA C4-type zinc finger protein [Schnuerera sp. xch1]MBZ2173941.1 TraR/DksA C4-type zinc finger protein [Schnuerera sp. xch1]
MDENKINYFKKRLFEEKEKILNIINRMNNNEEFGSMDEYHTDLSFYDNHPADLGTEVFMMEQENGFINKLNDTLYEIETSLDHVDSEDYGLCISCGKKIDEERLELMPYLKLCIDCAKKKIPLEKKMNFRPEEEESISPFSNNKNKEVNGFDTEDSYQEVARYNKIVKAPSQNTGDNLGVFDDENSGTVEDVEKFSQEYYDQTKE